MKEPTIKVGQGSEISIGLKKSIGEAQAALYAETDVEVPIANWMHAVYELFSSDSVNGPKAGSDSVPEQILQSFRSMPGKYVYIHQKDEADPRRFTNVVNTRLGPDTIRTAKLHKKLLRDIHGIETTIRELMDRAWFHCGERAIAEITSAIKQRAESAKVPGDTRNKAVRVDENITEALILLRELKQSGQDSQNRIDSIGRDIAKILKILDGGRGPQTKPGEQDSEKRGAANNKASNKSAVTDIAAALHESEARASELQAAVYAACRNGSRVVSGGGNGEHPARVAKGSAPDGGLHYRHR